MKNFSLTFYMAMGAIGIIGLIESIANFSLFQAFLSAAFIYGAGEFWSDVKKSLKNEKK